MAENFRAIGVLGWSHRSLEREVEKALDGIAADQSISTSSSTSRIFARFLQHHALVIGDTVHLEIVDERGLPSMSTSYPSVCRRLGSSPT